MAGKTTTQKQVVVIGSGVGGLATAVRMAAKGYGVTVFEQNSYVGGKVSPIEKNGFFWGFGASLFTFPELLDETFRACGRNPADYYEYQRIDPVCNYFFADGTRLSAYANQKKFAEEIENKTGEPAGHVLSHLQKIESVYENTKDIFLFNSLHKLSTYTSPQALKSVAHLHEVGITQNMNRVNQKRFKDPRVVQLFNRYATYNGSDPYKAPATLNVIAHPEYNRGGYFLKQGMPQLTKALYKLAVEMGVEFKLNTTVDAIYVEGGKATGIRANGKKYAADIVVSNMDVVFTYRKLMPGQPAPQRVLNSTKSTSAIVFYWGIKKEFPELDLHNIFFSGNYPQEFDYLTNKKWLSPDPTVYVFISSKLQKAHAPAGCENWFTLVNAPHNSGQDWDTLVAEARRNIIAKLNSHLGVDIEPLIITETINAAPQIEQKTQSYLGALYGNSSNDVFAAFLRHPNFSRKISNLYFCGGSVHPGGGVPLCLLSAKIIAKLEG